MRISILQIKLRKVKQNFICKGIEEPVSFLKEKLNKSDLKIREKQKICIAVGSRGIYGIAEMVKTVVDFVKEKGAEPFIIPAMGSHGGATSEGQQQILESYGINESTMGVPIISDMSTEKIFSGEKFSIFISKPALSADGIILINRIKPHTDYHGKYESGLVKMAVIGLGKHDMALEAHKYGAKGLKKIIPLAARKIFSKVNIIGGIAIIENALDKPEIIEVLDRVNIMEREPELLKIASNNMAKLPVDKIDILIIDYVGKNFSGTGLDTNVIGRMKIWGEKEPKSPSVKVIIVRDISDESHGNALGIGLADIITRRLYNKIDFKKMYENAFTSTFLERVKIPVIAENDEEALGYALRLCEDTPIEKLKIIRIKNTLSLEEIYVSECLYEDLIEQNKITPLTALEPLLYNKNMRDF